MSESLLFLRKVELIVGQKVAFTNGPVEPVDAIQFNTRVKFKVELDDSGNANKATITVYNLSEESKAFLEKENGIVFLNVGYQDSVSNLFFGDIQNVEEKRTGPDILTTLECGDAEKILREANIQIGLGPGATNRQVIDAAIAKLKIAKGYQTEIPEKTYQSGFSYSGPVKALLDEQFKSVDLSWSIQGGELQVTEKDKSDQQIAVEISKDSGLIGSVTKTKDGAKFKSLINTDLRPGRAVVINSKRFLDGSGVNGKITKTVFDGDSNDGAYFVEVEASIIK